jgi:hypothetical protein
VRRDEIVFFVDRCLGAHTVPDALHKAGALVEVHGTHFLPDASDTDILRFVGARGWAFLSKDENVRRRPAERRALTEANVAAFILTAGRAKGDVIAAAFVTALAKMQGICHAYARPVIATVSATGTIVVREGVRRGACGASRRVPRRCAGVDRNHVARGSLPLPSLHLGSKHLCNRPTLFGDCRDDGRSEIGIGFRPATGHDWSRTVTTGREPGRFGYADTGTIRLVSKAFVLVLPARSIPGASTLFGGCFATTSHRLVIASPVLQPQSRPPYRRGRFLAPPLLAFAVILSEGKDPTGGGHPGERDRREGSR